MDVHKLYKSLEQRFPERVVTQPQDPFRVLIFTILSQRTRDEQTKVASDRLLAKFPTAEDLSKARVKDIERLIKSAGFYRVKAKKIKEVCKILLERYQGEVPSDFQSLMSLPSVGRKTSQDIEQIRACEYRKPP
jgi:endonuclease-3